MKYILVLLGTIYKFYFALVFFVTLTLTYPFFKFLLKRGSQYEKVFRLFKIVATFLQWVGLAPLKKLNHPPFPNPPFIVIANHTSHLDIVQMYSIIPSYFLFLSIHQNMPLDQILHVQGIQHEPPLSLKYF